MNNTVSDNTSDHMPQLHLIKMHGCGNDYLFVDCFTQSDPAALGELSVRLSNRRTGIGSDGLVLMSPPSDDSADVVLQVFNADGSAAEMCGNAVRCVGMWMYQTGRAGKEIRIQMGTRLVHARIIESSPAAGTAIVEVNLGHSRIPPLSGNAAQSHIFPLSPASGERVTVRGAGPSAANSTPTAVVTPITLDDILIAGSPAVLHCVSIGNSHAVLFVDEIDSTEFLSLGPVIECHSAFPDRINVEFATVTSRDAVRVRVWERGSGETMACGSGACATAVAGIAIGLFDGTEPIVINMNGGTLHVTITPCGDVLLRGPAAHVGRITVAV
jgi:diaminopimelate epimerase